MKQYQLRVQNEKYDLDCKIGALEDFIGNKYFHDVPAEEQDRLKRQLTYMQFYSNVLGQRIDEFKE